MKNKTFQILLWVSIFSIAMGYLESSVVIYMRALYYPEGFYFPLKIIPYNILITELFRELSTIIMLLGIGAIAGRTNTEKFAYFIYAFGIWDIFYYLFLKVLLNWPDSLLTWDILFFIPTTWVGPVIAPVINSLTMIVLALSIIGFASKNEKTILNKTEWVLLISGSIIVIAAYTMEYVAYILTRFSLSDVFSTANKQEVIKYASEYVPKTFNWLCFGAGVVMHFATICLFVKRSFKLEKQII